MSFIKTDSGRGDGYFEEVALQAMAACNAHYQAICTRENVQGWAR